MLVITTTAPTDANAEQLMGIADYSSLQPLSLACMPPPSTPCRGLSDRAMQRVADYVHAHVAESITLDQLAAIAWMSRFHFARRFRMRTGMSPMQYVAHVRIETAKQLLSGERQRISSIAVTLGFFDQSHFTRVFRKVTGVSPGSFARQLHDRRVAAEGTQAPAVN